MILGAEFDLELRQASQDLGEESGAGDWTWFERFSETAHGLEFDTLKRMLAA